jgi:hypothetical protein
MNTLFTKEFWRAALVVAGLAVAMTVGAAQARTLEEWEAEEPLFHQHMEEFREWRAGIPDYDKRLYDRVRQQNTQIFRLQRIVVIGLVILFVTILLTSRNWTRASWLKAKVAAAFRRFKSGRKASTSGALLALFTVARDKVTSTFSDWVRRNRNEFVARQLAYQNVLLEENRVHIRRLEAICASYEADREAIRKAESEGSATPELSHERRLRMLEELAPKLETFISRSTRVVEALAATTGDQ